MFLGNHIEINPFSLPGNHPFRTQDYTKCVVGLQCLKNTADLRFRVGFDGLTSPARKYFIGMVVAVIVVMVVAAATVVIVIVAFMVMRVSGVIMAVPFVAVVFVMMSSMVMFFMVVPVVRMVMAAAACFPVLMMPAAFRAGNLCQQFFFQRPVSYTHLTLPTICSV